MATDLNRFINWDIEFKEIEGSVNDDVDIQNAIINSIHNFLFYKNDLDLYEKLCYSDFLRDIQYYSNCELYAAYIVIKINFLFLNLIEMVCLKNSKKNLECLKVKWNMEKFFFIKNIKVVFVHHI